ncbi:MAG: CDP-alcohol phosphatidyltransferase family protein [Nitrososphaerota archaeon]|jgi:archaetidylinositol phosphate synthase|nr:CDP-alcohol phosphatidyltransferase family protein [Nitrososphaerota archaeon]MDG6928086.1 CDP-alcohol phosphatidyltransferase family protein [Nitrososphaerota archaeon]MDG6929852.1 CDP-alcohol phosphatidyltransferase family protein [Nitrososphaerota archaeon]MDG6932897.1 CDP-alcohol phosphatidyltransferase family protein [Nitrososphaerota archaeon]MDG6936364.1 CDP-alcohol phosphatidyltransferase family protein [Nitrososphaerota archaeon]
MAEGLRHRTAPFVNRIAAAIARVLPYPNLFSFIGLVFGILAAFVLALRFYTLGGIVLLLSGAMDVLDGAIARATGKVSVSGAFLDSNFDRIVEMLIYLGIGISSYSLYIPAFLAFGFSIMVSYSRARLEGLSGGSRPKGMEIGERGIRLIVLCVLLLLELPLIALAVVTALALVTFGQRMLVYSRFLKGGSK